MTVESEMLIERKRVGRRLGLWRMIAVGLGLALLLALVVSSETTTASLGKDQIARVEITGMITDDAKQLKLLKKLKKSDKVKAVLLRINSPGGTTVGGEGLYLEIRELSEKKPVVAVLGTVAASAAYMAALATDRIVTRGSTITGSVGVIVQWPDMSELMGKLGVTMEELKSGKLKATPNPFKKDDPENLKPMKELVEDTYKWFIGLVEERRKLKAADVDGLSEGRIYSGRQAVKLGLVDAIGGQKEAIAWLEKEKKLDEDLPVVDHEPGSDNPLHPLLGLAGFLGRQLGVDALAELARWRPDLAVGSPGLMSIWRPMDMK